MDGIFSSPTQWSYFYVELEEPTIKPWTFIQIWPFGLDLGVLSSNQSSITSHAYPQFKCRSQSWDGKVGRGWSKVIYLFIPLLFQWSHRHALPIVCSILNLSSMKSTPTQTIQSRHDMWPMNRLLTFGWCTRWNPLPKQGEGIITYEWTRVNLSFIQHKHLIPYEFVTDSSQMTWTM